MNEQADDTVVEAFMGGREPGRLTSRDMAEFADTAAIVFNLRLCARCGNVVEAENSINATVCMGCRRDLRGKAESYGGTEDEIGGRFGSYMRQFRRNRAAFDEQTGGHLKAHRQRLAEAALWGRLAARLLEVSRDPGKLKKYSKARGKEVGL